MGSPISKVQQVLQEPATESELLQRLGHVDSKEVANWCKLLLSGATPTNFSLQDMAKYLHTISGEQFVILPIWTLNMTTTDAAAMSVLNHWPHCTPETLDDDTLVNTRLMLPLFKEGDPIGHARFLFYDRWQPMPKATLEAEHMQWKDILLEFLPVSDLCNTILLEYEGLCPSRHQTECATIKIIDSMPGNIKAFEREASVLEDVLEKLADPAWCPSWKRNSEENDFKLHCVRRYLSLVTGNGQDTSDATSGHIETTILPSTTQLGLECIIITLCRVLATWVNPCQIPIENCRDLCVDKKGRRILSDLLILDNTLESVHDSPPETKMHVCVPPAIKQLVSPTYEPPESAPHTPIKDRLDVWYAVYTVPTFQILSRKEDAAPHIIAFGDQAAYQVYRDCKWVHRSRSQCFTPRQTVLALGGKLGCLYICPVRNCVEGKWFFALLGAHGYHLFPADGKCFKTGQGGKKQRAHFTDGLPLMIDDPSWAAPVFAKDAFDVFLTTLKDGTWRQNKYTDVQDDTSVSDSTDTTPISTPTRRRSKRTPKPRKVPTVTATPQEQRKRPRTNSSSGSSSRSSKRVLADVTNRQRKIEKNKKRKARDPGAEKPESKLFAMIQAQQEQIKKLTGTIKSMEVVKKSAAEKKAEALSLPSQQPPMQHPQVHVPSPTTEMFSMMKEIVGLMHMMQTPPAAAQPAPVVHPVPPPPTPYPYGSPYYAHMFPPVSHAPPHNINVAPGHNAPPVFTLDAIASLAKAFRQ